MKYRIIINWIHLMKEACFCSAEEKTDRIKGLLWEGDGFLLLYKRLENGRYQWPRTAEELREMSMEQYQRLMSGLCIDSTIHLSKARYIR